MTRAVSPESRSRAVAIVLVASFGKRARYHIRVFLRQEPRYMNRRRESWIERRNRCRIPRYRIRLRINSQSVLCHTQAGVSLCPVELAHSWNLIKTHHFALFDRSTRESASENTKVILKSNEVLNSDAPIFGTFSVFHRYDVTRRSSPANRAKLAAWRVAFSSESRSCAAAIVLVASFGNRARYPSRFLLAQEPRVRTDIESIESSDRQASQSIN